MARMLFVHEVHAIAGGTADEFEAAYREGWLPALAGTDGARLLWYLHQAHGTGLAYRVVTVTAVASTDAWGELVERTSTGDLREWARTVDALRHDLQAKVLQPVPWSPLQEVDLGAVPTSGERETHVFMEDTAWPFRGRLDDYLEQAGTLYVDTLARSAAAGRAILELVGAFQPVFGTGRHREIVLWQRVARNEALVPLLTREVPPQHRAPGTWMHDALGLRDQWESRLLRTAAWSPLS
jgi:hypothetical protein